MDFVLDDIELDLLLIAPKFESQTGKIKHSDIEKYYNFTGYQGKLALSRAINQLHQYGLIYDYGTYYHVTPKGKDYVRIYNAEITGINVHGNYYRMRNSRNIFVKGDVICISCEKPIFEISKRIDKDTTLKKKEKKRSY